MGHTSQPTTRPTRCFWPRFTLRVLLVFVTLVGVGLGYWTHRARQQRRIVERIEQGGGMVCYERDGPTAPEPRNFAVEWLAAVLGRDYLERIVFVTAHDREVLPDLAGLRGLERMHIAYGDLNDDDMTVLASYRDLRELYIGYLPSEWNTGVSSKISDKSLDLIATLPRLERATIHGKGFTKKGIKTLASSPKLRYLIIGLCDESVVVDDFNEIKGQGRVQSLEAWRAKEGTLGFEKIIKW